MELNLRTVGGSPAFHLVDRSPNYLPVYGSQFDGKSGEWIFPAYPPFGLKVLGDLKKVAPGLPWSPEVKEQEARLLAVPDRFKARELPVFDYLTRPFAHQVEGLSWAYLHPRSALFFDPGTGKSKIVVDLVRLLRKERPVRALIVTPKVTVFNWVQEFRTHAGDLLRVAPLAGTLVQKRRLLGRYQDLDVLVCSYGSARNLGLPKVLPQAMKRMQAALVKGQLSPSMFQALGAQVRRLGDLEDQLRLIETRLAGATLPEVTKAVDEAVGAAPQWLEDLEYELIVADEGHSIGDAGSAQTKVLSALAKKAPRRLLMTGTPTEGDPLQLYPQLKFLAPCLVPEEWIDYSNRFLVRAKHNKRIVIGYQNLHLLNQRVQLVALNKRKEECLDLPPRMAPIDIRVVLSDEQKRIYNTLLKTLSLELAEFFAGAPEGKLKVQSRAVLLNKLAQVSSGFLFEGSPGREVCNGCEFLAECVETSVQPYTPACKRDLEPPPQKVRFTKENPKLSALEELLEGICRSPRHKVIVWAVFRPELDLIEQLLVRRKWGYVRVDGSSGGQVQARVDRFNREPEVLVYLGQVATGVGITLNAALYTIYFGLPWSLRQYLQSIDRNYRAGQTEKVTVYRLLGEETVDEYKAAALDQKRDMSTQLTSNLSCPACPHSLQCLKARVELFGPGCIYQRSVKRVVARVEEIGCG